MRTAVLRFIDKLEKNSLNKREEWIACIIPAHTA